MHWQHCDRQSGTPYGVEDSVCMLGLTIDSAYFESTAFGYY